MTLQPFVLTDEDILRHRGHKRQLLLHLNNGNWVAADRLVAMTGTKNFTARISNLRQDGYVIECSREGRAGGTYYRLRGKQDTPTTKSTHTCPNCGHRF